MNEIDAYHFPFSHENTRILIVIYKWYKLQVNRFCNWTKSKFSTTCDITYLKQFMCSV